MLFTKSAEARAYIRRVKAAQVASHPIERMFEHLLELLPRRMLSVKLLPASDVSIVDEATGAFRSLGNKPRFQISCTESFKPGWYYLEGSVVRHTGSRKALLEVEVESGRTSQPTAIAVPTNLRGTIQEVFFLPRHVRRLFWIPTEKSGFLEQGPFMLHRISMPESFVRRFYRVLTDSKRYAANGLRLRNSLFGLQAAYQRSAELRIARHAISYPDLFREYSTRLERNSQQFKQQEVLLTPKPLFSVITNVGELAGESLLHTIDSLAEQAYTKWQLVLIGNELEGHDDLQPLLQKRPNLHSQITFIRRPQGESGAEMLNAALGAASGDFILRLDQGDILLPHALLEVAKTVSLHPTVDFIYADNDSVDSFGNPCTPQFKPGWNPELLLSYDYIYRPAFYRKTTAIKVGGFRRSAEGAEDWDLSLRCLAGKEAALVAHIPLLLCRTRHVGKAAEDCTPDGLPQTTGLPHSVGKQVLQQHIALESAIAEDGPANGVFRVKYSLPTELPCVTIIIPTKDKRHLLEKCLDTLLRTTRYPRLEIIVVDNQTTESDALEHLHAVSTHEDVRVLSYPQPFNWAAINNFAIAQANGSIVVALNNDIEIISADWLCEMVSHAIRTNVGVVGAKLLYPDLSVQHSGVVLGIGGVAGHVHRFLDDRDLGYCYRAEVVQNYSAVTGACMAFRREVFDAVGGFDERFAVAFNDIDFCLRVKKAGFSIVYTPYAKLIHHESISRGTNDTPDKKELFRREFDLMRGLWQDDIEKEEFYNPNLTSQFLDYSYASALAARHGGRLSRTRAASVPAERA